jgi:hypothetical protein
VLLLTACGSKAAPSQVTLHGTVSEAGVCGRPIPPNMAATAVVDIVSPSGTELAQVKVNQLTPSRTARCSIPFAAKLPHERLYGVRVEGETGTVWVKPGAHAVVRGTL